MENVKNAKSVDKKCKRCLILKRIVFILLFVIFLPFMIISYTVRYFVKKNKKKKWLKEGLRGKLLILKSDIKDIDKMEDYELEYYLKTLFFYAGYKVYDSEKDKGVDSFLIEKSEDKIVVLFNSNKKVVNSNQIYKLLKLTKIYKVTNSFFVTKAYFSGEAQSLADSNNIFLMDRDKLISEYKRVQEKLERNIDKEDLVNKFDKNIQEKFPNMI